MRGGPSTDAVLAAQARAHDYTQVGKPRIAWDDEAARAELVDALVGDAHRILGVPIVSPERVTWSEDSQA